jgi:uncharacterized Zn finger protein (UPF0148 family)
MCKVTDPCPECGSPTSRKAVRCAINETVYDVICALCKKCNSIVGKELEEAETLIQDHLKTNEKFKIING